MMDREALRLYFSEKMGNASIPPDVITPGPYQVYGPGGELETIVPYKPIQYEYLGLGAQIKLQEQLIAHMKSPDLESGYTKLSDLERKQRALEMLIRAKRLDLPNPDAWRHPVMPWGWKEDYERLAIEFPHKSVSEMSHGGKSQTGEGKKKVRKFSKIHPKPVKIKS